MNKFTVKSKKLLSSLHLPVHVDPLCSICWMWARFD